MPRPVSTLPRDAAARGFGEGRVSHPYAFAAARTTASERALRNTSSSLACFQHVEAELHGIGLRRRGQLVDERLERERRPAARSGSRRLPVRSGVSQIIGNPTIRVVVRRFGIAYIEVGASVLPLAGCAGRRPMSCAISTVSGSLYQRWL